MPLEQTNEAFDFEKYYNAVMDMIHSDGWKYLTSDLANNAVNINSVEQTKDAEDLAFRKGQLTVLANVLNLETQMQTLREQQEESEAEEAA